MFVYEKCTGLQQYAQFLSGENRLILPVADMSPECGPSPTRCKVQPMLLLCILQSKPDLIANSELAELRPPLSHGHVPGVVVGQEFANRGELAIVGIHTQIMRGINSL
jgi:hypothetical protein